MGWTSLTIFIAFVGLLIGLYNSGHFRDLENHIFAGGPMKEHAGDVISRLSEKGKFPLFSTLVPDKEVYHFAADKVLTSVKSAVYVNDDDIRLLVDKRMPCVLTGSSASRWKALDWDLWTLSKQFPLLLGTAVVEGLSESTVLLSYDRDPGGMLNDHGDISPAEVVQDMFFINFLLSCKNSALRMFYASDFRIFERMLKVGFSDFF